MPDVKLYQGEASPTDVRLRNPAVDDVLANDVQSTSEVSVPAIAQVHALLADDVQSTSNVTSPAVGQKHALLADDVQNTSNVTTPAVAQVHGLLADDVQSTSQVTAPAVGQKHVLLANDTESASQVTTPAVGQQHVLLADDAQATSEVTLSAVGQVHALLANDAESASQVSAPALGQVHILNAVSVESASVVSSPALTVIASTARKRGTFGGPRKLSFATLRKMQRRAAKRIEDERRRPVDTTAATVLLPVVTAKPAVLPHRTETARQNAPVVATVQNVIARATEGANEALAQKKRRNRRMRVMLLLDA